MSHLEETLGTNPVQCNEDHEMRNVYRVTVLNADFTPALLKIGGMSDPADWQWASSKFNLTANNTGLMVCFDCELDKPSRLAVIAKNAARANKMANEATMRTEAWADGDPLVQCPDCDLVMHQDDAVQVRHCTFCEITFNGTDNGRNCEQCNRPFTSKITESGCPECLSEDNECQAYE